MDQKKYKRIPVFDFVVGETEKKFVNDCLDTSFLGQGSYVKNFENEFSKFVDCEFGITTTSGTTALHLACKTLGIGEGDEVLVSSSTNMASAFSVDYCGGVPIPVDIEKETWQMDVTQIEKKITKKTKAIMVVHLFGHPVDMDPVLEIAKKNKLKVIEDCAEAHGVEYKGKKVGSIGDIGAFSFFANKTITCGEGGMVVTNSKAIAEKAKSLKNMSYGKENKFIHDDIGFNYRMPNINAAIGLGQFRSIEKIFIEKDRIYKRYKKNLKDIKGVKIPEVRDWASKYIMWIFNMYLDNLYPLSRDELVKKLAEKNIETRNAFVPMNKQMTLVNKYNLYKEEECPNANYIMDNGFYLPSGNNLTNGDIDFVCAEILKHSK
jgi:perosamine synthetase|tara:strand:+ start:404 stop:1534 length:1131 start_codon:yes stop_codon:yes gene_type:complete